MVGDTHQVTRKIGFVPLPLFCLVLRIMGKTISFFGSLQSALLTLLVYIIICLLKVQLRKTLFFKSLKYYKSHSQDVIIF